MGWALDNLSANTRESIARSLFEANQCVDIVDGDTWINGLCPFHDDKKQSFGYNITRDLFHCLALCCPDSDLIDFWCLRNGYPPKSTAGFKAFKRQFAGESGVGAPKRKTPGQLQPQKPQNDSTPKPEAEKEPQKTIPEDVYKHFLPIPDDFMSELHISRGWTRETIDELGIRLCSHFRKKSNPYGNLFPTSSQGRIVIPIRDDTGALFNLRVYYPLGLPEDAPADTQKIISWAKGHGQARLFPNPALLHPGPVLLCEGEPDCICARSHGLNAITQTSKTTHWPEEHTRPLHGRDVIIAYDADKSGQKYAQGAAVSLHKAGVKVRILEWPDYMGRLPNGEWPDTHGQDLTDFFTKHHKDVHALQVLMEQARPYGVPSGISLDKNLNSYLQFFGNSANGRWCFRERLLVDYLIDKHKMVYHDKSGQLYCWNSTCFEPWSPEHLRAAAIDALGDELKSTWVSAACTSVMSLVSMPHGRDLNDREGWVCLQNGMLNIYTLEFAPHSPDYLATVKLGVSWHGDQTPKPERWIKFLEQTIQTPEVILQAQEYAGYCLTRDTRFGKALLLFGPGADGKSKFINVLRTLVGPQNCSAVSMSGLDDQFQRAALFGKILNVATEITTEAIQSEMFKAVVTGDPIQASFKHKDSFEFVPYAKLVYATNKMPRVFDNSDGYFRRLQPILFKKQFLEGDPDLDPDLESKLMAELDGIFAWALIGLHRLIEQKGFTVCDETLDFMMKYRRYNNPVMAFVQDRCSLEDSASEVPIKELYKAYKEYCSEGGFRPANRENFWEELQTACRKLNEDAAIRRHKPRRDGQRPDLVVGVKLLFTLTE